MICVGVVGDDEPKGSPTVIELLKPLCILNSGIIPATNEESL